MNAIAGNAVIDDPARLTTERRNRTLGATSALGRRTYSDAPSARSGLCEEARQSAGSSGSRCLALSALFLDRPVHVRTSSRPRHCTATIGDSPGQEGRGPDHGRHRDSSFAAAIILPLVVSTTGHADWTLPSIAITVGPLLLWLDFRVRIPRYRPVGWALTIGPLILVTAMSGKALVATTGLGAGLLLLATALAGFRELSVAGLETRPASVAPDPDLRRSANDA